MSKNRVAWKYSCAFANCSGDLRRSVKNLSWHRFPALNMYRAVKHRWIAVVRRSRDDAEWEPKESDRICSRHFENDDFMSLGLNRQTVKVTAIPKWNIEHEVSLSSHIPPTIAESSSQVGSKLTTPSSSPTTLVSNEDHLPDDEPHIETSLDITATVALNGLLIKHLRESDLCAGFPKLKIKATLMFDDIDLDLRNPVAEFSTIINCIDPGLNKKDDNLLHFHAYVPDTDKPNECGTNRFHKTATAYDTPVRVVKKLGVRTAGILKSKKLFTAESSPDKSPIASLSSFKIVTPRSRKQAAIDHSYFKSPRSAIQRLAHRNLVQAKKLNAMKVKTIRQRMRVKKLKITLREKLQKSGDLSEEKLKLITAQFPMVLKTLVDNELKAGQVKKTVGMRYGEDMKKFANTLHFYSPKAYDFLRRYLTLPHPSTLISWMSSVDIQAGFCQEVLQRLGEARSQDTRNMMTDVVMQVDEMAIRKDAAWDASRHQFSGFVNHGNAEIRDSLATNALVCLIAGISGGWKCPIGYIFTDKVDGRDMHKFVCKGFDLLEKEGFDVHALVSDGYTANVHMFEKLGASEGQNKKASGLTPIKYQQVEPHFSNPANSERQVSAIYDIVHMQKLWRNFLAQCDGINWVHGSIEWSFIVKLHELQENEGLIAANKLSRYHIEFEKHKMKVSLSTQSISSSVADAIDFCRDDLRLDEFQGSESTSRFIRCMDKAFDFLNSHQHNAKGYKEPLTKENFESKAQFLEDFAKQLLTVTFVETRKEKKGVKRVTKLACRGNRKRPVLGFVTSIKAILFISRKLLWRQAKPFLYVLTYRFSQDLLELFFNKVRGRLGRNNNPNCIEFRNIMKRVWHENLLKSSNTGNCVQKMDDFEIPGGLLPLVPKKKVKRSPHTAVTEECINDLEDIEYSQFYLNCLGYIAGNVSSTVSDSLTCLECKTALRDGPADCLDKSVLLLIKRKDRGGLYFPSQSVYRLVEMTDIVFRSVLRQFAGPPTLNDLDTRICNTVMSKCVGLNLFPGMANHALYYDTKLQESHFSHLIRRVVRHFVKIRLFNYGKSYQRSLNVSNRHKMSKQILFNNE